MRWRSLVLSVAFACAEDVGLGGDSSGDGRTPIGERTAPIIGGSYDDGDPAVVRVDFPGTYCSGTVISDRVILTAAHCVDEVIAAGTVESGVVSFGPPSFDESAVEAIWVHRKFARQWTDYNSDLAVVLMTQSASARGLAPLPVNATPLEGVIARGDLVRSIGYGRTDKDDPSSGGTKHTARIPVVSVAAKAYEIGDPPSLGTCYGDSGGPDLFTIDGENRVIGVHSWVRSGCTWTSHSVRVDRYVDEFIYPAIDSWEGPCRADGACITDGCRTPDPDCDPCGAQGVCVEDCPQPDWDCPIGGRLGERCEDDFDCESRRCIAAVDDPRVTYCSDVCDPAVPHFWCPLVFDCASVDGESLCVYREPTPGASGTLCANDATCGSGACDSTFGICVERCLDGACADGTECVTTDDGEVCLPTEADGKGCGCRVGGRRGASSALVVAIALLALLSGARSATAVGRSTCGRPPPPAPPR